MFPYLFAAIVFAAPPERTPDLVVKGTVASVAPAEPLAQWDVARSRSFEVYWPAGVDAYVCLAVQEVVQGDLFGDEVCFLRASELAAAMREGTVGNEGTWRLFETPYGHRYYADEAATPRPDADGLRKRIADGTPQERTAAMALAADLGLLAHVPDLIAAITDARLVQGEGTLARPAGAHAVDALLPIAARIDPAMKGPPDAMRFGDAAVVGFDRRATAVQADWKAWWEKWKQDGPGRAVEPGGPTTTAGPATGITSEPVTDP